MKAKAKAKKVPKKPAKKATARRPRALRHDTPLDMPAVIQVAPPGREAAASNALARMRRLETIPAAYDAWIELRLEHSGALLELGEERKQLEQQGEFLVGAVRAARNLSRRPTVQEALALAKTGDGLDRFLVESAARLETAKTSVEDRSRTAEAAFASAFEAIRTELRSRITRTLQHVRPRLKLMVRPVGAETRILHLARLPPEEAVLLAWLLNERLPSRYDFLFDDSTDDLSQAPPTLFAEEGVAQRDVRPTTAQLQLLLSRTAEVLPVKGVLPFFLPAPEGPPRLARFVQRGPVMEAELADEAAFRNVLTRDEAEAVAGYLLQLKLQGRVELELSNG